VANGASIDEEYRPRADLALTWSHVKLAKEMARTHTVSNQQASPNTLAKSTASGPKAMRYRNGSMRIVIWFA